MAIDPSKPYDLHYEVVPLYDRQRLDLFVKAMIPSMSRTRIQQRIREGRVEVNGHVRPANWRVLADDAVRIRCAVPGAGVEDGKSMPLDILYEDDDVIAVNKQAGVVVHPVGKHRHDTLLNGLYWRYRDILPDGDSISLANRLDQYTSGVILATKNTRAKRILQVDFEARLPRKSYLALCRGVPELAEGEIDLPIGPAPAGQDHCRMAVRTDGAGKASRTLYRIEERFGSAFSLVRLFPVTGRQHQLRVHMAAVGCPLVADPRYGGGFRLEIFRDVGDVLALDRYALHAAELNFRHPTTGREVRVVAPLPPDMAGMVALLRQGAREMVGGMILTRPPA